MESLDREDLIMDNQLVSQSPYALLLKRLAFLAATEETLKAVEEACWEKFN